MPVSPAGSRYPREALERPLRTARGQRGIMECILVQVGLLIGVIIDLPPLLLTGLTSVVGVASVVFVLLLARELFGTIMTLVCLALLVLPALAVVLASASPAVTLLSLFALLIANRCATSELERAGIRVGLLGADPRQIRARLAPVSDA